MSRARELDTDMDTLVGHDLDAPFTGPDTKKFPEMEEEDFQLYQNAVDEADEVEPRQLSSPEEDDAVPFVHTEAEKDAAMRIRDLRLAPPPAPKGVKRPRSPLPEDDVPDLAEIFDNYDTPYPVRISICRAYASYLASMQPKKPKAKKASKK